MGTTTRRLLLALPLFGAVLLSACGGDKPAAPEAGQPPAAVVEPTVSVVDSFDFARIKPILPAAPTDESSLTLGATARQLEQKLSQALATGGLTADVFVFSITGLDQWLLVLDLNDSQIAPLFSDSSAFLRALTPALPLIRQHNITRLALNVTTKDQQGPLAVTITLPISAIEASLAGTLSQADLKSQLLYETTRPAQP